MATLLRYNPAVVQALILNSRTYRYDPTRTTALRNAFVADMSRRFNELKRVIKKAIVDEDCFGLKDPTPALVGVWVDLPGRKAFAFPRSADKVKAFMAWLQQQEKAGLLQTAQYAQLGVGVEAAWTNIYIQDSYKRGMLRGRYEMGKAGFPVNPLNSTGDIMASMSTPFHIDRLGLLYSRTFEELKGITAAMDTQISRILADGIGQGDGPALLARKMLAAIDGSEAGTLGITDRLGRFIPAQRRATIMARTEIIRAHHGAMVQEYRNWGVAGVHVKAEFVTAEDERVCEECMKYETEGPYTLEQVETLIPIHPQCRCIAIPTMPEAPKIPVEDTSLPANLDETIKFFESDALFTRIQRKRGFDYSSKEDFFNSVFVSEEKALEILKSAVDESSVYMSIDGNLLSRMVKADDYFKNSLETGKGTFKTIGNARAVKERKIFGIPDAVVDPNEFPKYGFVSGKDAMTHETIVGWGYGDTFIRFKPGIKKRATMTFGDSYDGNYFLKATPTPDDILKIAPAVKMTDPSASFLLAGSNYPKGAPVTKILSKARTMDEFAKITGNYVEAQLYGKITLADVDAIFVQSKAQRTALKKLIAKSPYKDIKVIDSQFDSRIKAVWEGLTDYSGKNLNYAASIKPENIARFGDQWIDRMADRWIGTWVSRMKNAPNEVIPESLKSGIMKFSQKTLSQEEKRAWLIDYYTRMSQGPSGGLPKVFYEDYRVTLTGWMDDIINEGLLINYPY